MRYSESHVSQFDAVKYRKDRRSKRKSLGLCTRCDNRAAEGKSDCLSCIKDGKLRAKKRITVGTCISCSNLARKDAVRCSDCSLKSNRLAKVRQRERKLKILAHYGFEGELKCCWIGCTVTDVDMLTLDHIGNDGAKHRREYTKSGRGGGSTLYDRLIREGYPKGFQTLCANHNLKKHIMTLS